MKNIFMFITISVRNELSQKEMFPSQIVFQVHFLSLYGVFIFFSNLLKMSVIFNVKFLNFV